jgi:flavin reductase (DIM6/NTAB) family NADH-FMN oxidoreductase RutF
MSESDPQRLQMGKAIGRIPSGVFVLTVHHEGKSHAMIASWVQQASFEPPALSMALEKSRPMAKTIRAAKKFALSVLPDDDKTLMKHYAKPFEDADPFEGVRTQQTPGGISVLADALAWLECTLISTCDFAADHEIFLGQINAASILKEGKPYTHIRGNGYHY